MVRKSNENVWPCSLFTCLFEQTKYQVDLNVNRLQCAPYWANNQDVDNILSKKIKPYSSHILDMYIF